LPDKQVKNLKARNVSGTILYLLERMHCIELQVLLPILYSPSIPNNMNAFTYVLQNFIKEEFS